MHIEVLSLEFMHVTFNVAETITLKSSEKARKLGWFLEVVTISLQNIC